MSYDSDFGDNDFDGNPEGQYLMDLIELAPSTSSVLSQMSQEIPFRAFLTAAEIGSKKSGISLTANEVNMMLDPDHVQWDSFHTSLLQSIFDNRATNKTNASIRTRIHTDNKFATMHDLSVKNTPPSV